MNIPSSNYYQVEEAKILARAEKEGHGIIVSIEGETKFEVDYEWYKREMEIAGLGWGE